MKPLTISTRRIKNIQNTGRCAGTNAGNQALQSLNIVILYPHTDSRLLERHNSSIHSFYRIRRCIRVNELNAGDTITITFSEKINLYPLNTVYGVSTSPKSNWPGGLSVDNNGDITVNGVVKLWVWDYLKFQQL